MSADRPHLRVVRATGVPIDRAVNLDDDGQITWAKRHTACAGCQEATAAGDEITYYERSWWHLACARRDLAPKPVSQAWIALARQVVKRPSGFKPREVKVITQALLDIAQPGYVIERRPS